MSFGERTGEGHEITMTTQRKNPVANTNARVDNHFFASLLSFLWLRQDESAAAAATPAAHWTPAKAFDAWMDKVISRTQVPEGVLSLALLIIFRLVQKTKVQGWRGSEYRVALVSLMLANKVLEDNTFTARTWVDVGGIDLDAILFGEREVLRALDWRIQPKMDEHADWVRRIASYHVKRHDALAVSALAPTISPPAIPLFDPGYTLYTAPFLTPTSRSRSMPGSPRRSVEAHNAIQLGQGGSRKRSADEAGLGSAHLTEPAAAVRRLSGPLLSPGDARPRSSHGAPPLYQTALFHRHLRSASHSPISACTPYSSTTSSLYPTPYTTPPAAFAPAFEYLCDALPSPAPTTSYGPLYYSTLVTDKRGHITTQLMPAPQVNVGPLATPAPAYYPLSNHKSPPPYNHIRVVPSYAL